MTLQELESLYTSGLYTKRPLAIVRGEGARLWDSDGHEYIDCVGGQGAGNLGHGNAAVADALAAQARPPRPRHSRSRAGRGRRAARHTGFSARGAAPLPRARGDADH